MKNNYTNVQVGKQIRDILIELDGLPVRRMSVSKKTLFFLDYAITPVRQELADFDRKYVHATAPSIDFVTNTLGCLIVAEAIKFLTGRGSVTRYPKAIDYNIFKCRFKIINSNSILSKGNILKVLSMTKHK